MPGPFKDNIDTTMSIPNTFPLKGIPQTSSYTNDTRFETLAIGLHIKTHQGLK